MNVFEQMQYINQTGYLLQNYFNSRCDPAPPVRRHQFSLDISFCNTFSLDCSQHHQIFSVEQCDDFMGNQTGEFYVSASTFLNQCHIS